MRRLLTLTALLAFASALAFAESWTGTLIDAACAQQSKGEACVPTATTTSFAIAASGKVFKLDAQGNSKAAAALKMNDSNANRQKDPNAPAMPVTATVNGTLSGDEIKVETISVP